MIECEESLSVCVVVEMTRAKQLFITDKPEGKKSPCIGASAGLAGFNIDHSIPSLVLYIGDSSSSYSLKPYPLRKTELRCEKKMKQLLK